MTKELHVKTFSRIADSLPGFGLPWLRELRGRAIARFDETGFPSRQDEGWRFTELGPIAQTPFEMALDGSANGSDAEKLARSALGRDYSCRLVFKDGRYDPALSWTPPGSARVGSLAQLLKDDPAAVEPYLSSKAAVSGQAFSTLNTAMFGDGAFVMLPEGMAQTRPIHLLFLSSAPVGAPKMAHSRILIVAGNGAKASIIEEYAGFGPGVYFTNLVSQIFVGENAAIDHYKLQRESETAFHVATLQVHQGRNSAFVSHSVSLGGALVRNDVDVSLEAEGADCALNGLYLAHGSQHIDNHTVIDHLRPHCSSRELYKGVLDGRARAVFNGSIIVQPEAQKTNALVYNKNLLLSEEGLVNTKPEFKINANDVQCKHGATVGQLSSDALFYLRSRGIGAQEARRLLVYAFASEMLGRMAVESVRQGLSGVLQQWLPERVD